MTVAFMLHRVGWTELIDRSSYCASCVLDGND